MIILIIRLPQVAGWIENTEAEEAKRNAARASGDQVVVELVAGGVDEQEARAERAAHVRERVHRAELEPRVELLEASEMLDLARRLRALRRARAALVACARAECTRTLKSNV